jgi:hypothetical protein
MFGWVNRLFTGLFTATTPSLPGGRRAVGRRVEGRLEPESRFVVTIDPDRVLCRRPSGDEESVRWDALAVVIVETNDTGPWGCDVWWILGGRDAKSGCVIPQGATGEKELLEALQRLPGFDNHALIDAMCCMDNKRFLCWRRSAGVAATSGGE